MHCKHFEVYTDFLLQVNALNVALKFDERGHRCKNPPTQVANFYLESNRLEASHFTGLLKVDLYIRTLSEPSEESWCHTCVLHIGRIERTTLLTYKPKCG